MQIGYIMLDKVGTSVLIKVQTQLRNLRTDQRTHVAHLIRAWKRFELNDVRRAIKRTLADRP